MLPIVELPNIPNNSTAQNVDKGENEPHSRNTFLFAKLTLVKGKFLFATSEQHFNAPSFRIDTENLLCSKLCLRGDKFAQSLSVIEGFLRIAQQKNSILVVIHFALVSVYKITPVANCHEADVQIILADTGCRLFGLLPDLIRIDETISTQCANRLKSLLSKGVHQFV